MRLVASKLLFHAEFINNRISDNFKFHMRYEALCGQKPHMRDGIKFLLQTQI